MRICSVIEQCFRDGYIVSLACGMKRGAQTREASMFEGEGVIVAPGIDIDSSLDELCNQVCAFGLVGPFRCAVGQVAMLEIDTLEQEVDDNDTTDGNSR